MLREGGGGAGGWVKGGCVGVRGKSCCGQGGGEGRRGSGGGWEGVMLWEGGGGHTVLQ